MKYLAKVNYELEVEVKLPTHSDTGYENELKSYKVE